LLPYKTGLSTIQVPDVSSDKSAIEETCTCC
jgi:hypothetical protein